MKVMPSGGIHIDLLQALGHNPATIGFATLPHLGDTGRLAIRNFRNDGVETEALVTWLCGGARFNLRNLTRIPDPAALPALNREILAQRDFACGRGSSAARRHRDVLACDPRPYRSADRGAALVECR